MFNCWCLNVFSFRFPASGCLQSVSPGTASLSCSCSSWSSPPLPASSGRCQSPWGYWWWPYTSYSLLCRSAYRNVFSQFEQQIFQSKYIPRHTDVQEWKCLFWTFPAFHAALLHSVHYKENYLHFSHMGREHASREKKLSMVNFLIFVQKRIRFQEIKICPWKGFEKMRFLFFSHYRGDPSNCPWLIWVHFRGPWPI